MLVQRRRLFRGARIHLSEAFANFLKGEGCEVMASAGLVSWHRLMQEESRR
jgi:hypothetical protein